jgi:hypothetical protein
MTFQLYTPALNNALDNLIKGVKDLTNSLSTGNMSPYLTPPQTPGKSCKNASEVAVTSPYFTRKATRKRDRSPSPLPRKKKPRKSVDISSTSLAQRRQQVVDTVEIPITSPYFLPTPQSENAPTTPVRCGKDGMVMSSPYFSGTAQVAGPTQPKRRRKKTAPVVDVEQILPVIDPPEFWWKTERLPVKDALSFIHFRRHSVQYYQLWLAKPVLIQGTHVTPLFPLCCVEFPPRTSL